jgi:hypothetical protein
MTKFGASRRVITIWRKRCAGAMPGACRRWWSLRRTQSISNRPRRHVLIAFDNPEKALAWSNAPVTKEVTGARIKNN